MYFHAWDPLSGALREYQPMTPMVAYRCVSNSVHHAQACWLYTWREGHHNFTTGLIHSHNVQHFEQLIKTDDDINASIIAEYIKIRDDTMTCDTMNQCDANDSHVFEDLTT